VLATQAEGRTLVHDWMYELRLFALEQLSAIRADLFLCDPHRIIVTGRRKLFDVAMNSGKDGPDYPYDVSPDGKHFLVIDNGVTPHNAPITVVLHWRSPLKQ